MQRKSSEKSKMTLDKLAGMMQRGFVHLEEKLTQKIDGVEARLDKEIEGGADRLDRKIDGVADRIDRKIDSLQTETRQGFSEVRQELSSLNKRVGSIEDKIDNIAEHQEFQDLSARVKYIEGKMGIVSGK